MRLKNAPLLFPRVSQTEKPFVGLLDALPKDRILYVIIAGEVNSAEQIGTVPSLALPNVTWQNTANDTSIKPKFATPNETTKSSMARSFATAYTSLYPHRRLHLVWNSKTEHTNTGFRCGVGAWGEYATAFVGATTRAEYFAEVSRQLQDALLAGRKPVPLLLWLQSERETSSIKDLNCRPAAMGGINGAHANFYTFMEENRELLGFSLPTVDYVINANYAGAAAAQVTAARARMYENVENNKLYMRAVDTTGSLLNLDGIRYTHEGFESLAAKTFPAIADLPLREFTGLQTRSLVIPNYGLTQSVAQPVLANFDSQLRLFISSKKLVNNQRTPLIQADRTKVDFDKNGWLPVDKSGARFQISQQNSSEVLFSAVTNTFKTVNVNGVTALHVLPEVEGVIRSYDSRAVTKIDSLNSWYAFLFFHGSAGNNTAVRFTTATGATLFAIRPLTTGTCQILNTNFTTGSSGVIAYTIPAKPNSWSLAIMTHTSTESKLWVNGTLRRTWTGTNRHAVNNTVRINWTDRFPATWPIALLCYGTGSIDEAALRTAITSGFGVVLS